jgi:sugar/nucleoside kinase (ribokinase family)
MKLTLIGKRYLDTIYQISRFVKNETNAARFLGQQYGGMYNVNNLKIKDLEIYLLPDGEKRAIILEEKEEGVRSSITWDEVPCLKRSLRGVENSDWVHVMYVDDMENIERLLNIQPKMSLDFCTTRPREQFKDVIDASEIVFDSRERKHLYADIKTKTPLVFHDKYGCEVVVEGSIKYEGHTKPVDYLSVNGAGDIFAVCFLKQYHNTSLQKAALFTSEKTTSELIRRHHEKVQHAHPSRG